MMEPEMFREMLDRVSPRIEKSQQDRPQLSPGLKLAITLRFTDTFCYRTIIVRRPYD